jgi:arginase
VVRFINVPFNSAGFSTGVARMPESLGFDGVTIPVSAEPVRGPHGLLAEKSLVRMVTGVESAVRECFASAELPVVIGGDCPILLGALAAMDDPGLVFLDGHEDAWQPTPDVRGEASDSELGIAIGIVPAPVPAVVDRSRVVALGPRDASEMTEVGHARIDSLVTFRDDVWLNSASAHDLLEVAAPATSGPWWLHVDLDVLSTSALGAVDYPQPGGLTWRRLERTVGLLVADGGCVGASVGVYNPDLDRGASAKRIVTFVDRLAKWLERARPTLS